MVVVSSREFRDNQKKFFDMAEVQRVLVKRRNRYIELVPRSSEIPENISPSNDPYFNNPNNIRKILEASENVKEGKTVKLTEELRKELFE